MQRRMEPLFFFAITMFEDHGLGRAESIRLQGINPLSLIEVCGYSGAVSFDRVVVPQIDVVLHCWVAAHILGASGKDRGLHFVRKSRNCVLSSLEVAESSSCSRLKSTGSSSFYSPSSISHRLEFTKGCSG